MDDLTFVVDGDFMILEVNWRLDLPRLSNMCLLMMRSVRGWWGPESGRVWCVLEVLEVKTHVRETVEVLWWPVETMGSPGPWLGSCPGAGGAPLLASTGSTPGSPTTWTGSTRRPTTCTMGELGGSHGHCFLIWPSVFCMLIYICNNKIDELW